MAETTRKGVWDLQQVRDQILDNVWEQQFGLFAWGGNSYGLLGLNDVILRSSPVQIPGTTWSSISAGRQHTLATKTDNTLWSWGSGTYGQLGQNNVTRFSSPVQIPGTTWSSISGCGFHSLATNTDGTLWAWGSNLTGAFANGTSGYRSSPVQVLSGTSGWDWVSVISSNDYGNSSSIIAIRTT